MFWLPFQYMQWKKVGRTECKWIIYWLSPSDTPFTSAPRSKFTSERKEDEKNPIGEWKLMDCLFNWSDLKCLLLVCNLLTISSSVHLVLNWISFICVMFAPLSPFPSFLVTHVLNNNLMTKTRIELMWSVFIEDIIMWILAYKNYLILHWKNFHSCKSITCWRLTTRSLRFSHTESNTFSWKKLNDKPHHHYC